MVEVLDRVGETVVATLTTSPALVLAQVQKVLAIEQFVELLVLEEQEAVQKDVVVLTRVDEPFELGVKRVHVDGLDRVEVVRVEIGYVFEMLHVTRVVEVVLSEQNRVDERFLKSMRDGCLAAIGTTLFLLLVNLVIF